MVLLPGDINPVDTTITGKSTSYIKLTGAKKAIHTGTNLVVLSGSLFHFQTNTTIAAGYNLTEPYTFDVSYDKLNNKYYSANFTQTYNDHKKYYSGGNYYDNFIRDLRFNSVTLPDFNDVIITTGNIKFKSIWELYKNSQNLLGFCYLNLDDIVGNIKFSGAPNYYSQQLIPQNNIYSYFNTAILKTSGNIEANQSYISSLNYQFNNTTISSALYGAFLTERSTQTSIENSIIFKDGVVSTPSGLYSVALAVSGGYFSNTRPIISGGTIGYFNNFDFRFLNLHNAVSGIGLNVADLYNNTTSTGWIDINISGITNTSYVENINVYHNNGTTNYNKTNVGLVLSPSGIRRNYNVDDLLTYVSEPRFFSAAGSGINLNFQIYFKTSPLVITTGATTITNTSGSLLNKKGTNNYSINYSFNEAVTSGYNYFTINPDIFYLTNPSGNLNNRYVQMSDFNITYSGNSSLDLAFTTDTPAIGFSGIKLQEIDFKGRTFSTIINNLAYAIPSNDYLTSGIFNTNSAFELVSKNVNLAVDENSNAYIKINNDLYKIPISGNAFPTSGNYTAPNANIYSLSGVFNNQISDMQFNRTNNGFLQYTSYESNINEITIKTISTTGVSPIASTRQLFLEMPTWSNKTTTITGQGNNCTFYLHGSDHNTLFVASTSGSNVRLGSYNIDKTIPAFIGINLNDTSLRAGTSQTSTVNAEVISAWGDPLNNITVNYDLITGDGVVSPTSVSTNTSGLAQSTYTVGITPGSVIIRGSVSN